MDGGVVDHRVAVAVRHADGLEAPVDMVGATNRDAVTARRVERLWPRLLRRRQQVLVPPGSVQLRVAPGQQTGAAGHAGLRATVGMIEPNALPSQRVEIRRLQPRGMAAQRIEAMLIREDEEEIGLPCHQSAFP